MEKLQPSAEGRGTIGGLQTHDSTAGCADNNLHQLGRTGTLVHGITEGSRVFHARHRLPRPMSLRRVSPLTKKKYAPSITSFRCASTTSGSTSASGDFSLTPLKTS